ncbi:testis-expressed protein 101 isoform X2 [Monodelphis domestica]|uniref:testis-expressed protein 101 isoform X2 n=1 Tax=Monodelphis domestica TaxID=13616 RepID=UPI0024E241F8|nr:testis-expressed protein 101 isoform X2 [Monodelphis domestica]
MGSEAPPRRSEFPAHSLRILGPEGQGGPKTGRKVHGAAMGCPSFPLLLGLVGAFLGQPEDRFDNPVFPVLRHVICYRTEMLHIGRKLSSKPVHWSRGRNQTARCESWEVCQETLVMVDTGPQTLIVGSKGCTPAGMRMSQVTHHLGPTGIIVTSYVRFCNFNYCNNSSSTAAVLTFRAPPVTADSEQALYCPTCLALYSCPDKIRFRQCSEDAISCYNGTIHIKGGDLGPHSPTVPLSHPGRGAEGSPGGQLAVWGPEEEALRAQGQEVCPKAPEPQPRLLLRC